MNFPIDEVRALTPGCDAVVHLNNAGSALPPAAVHDAVREHLELEQTLGGYEAAEIASEDIDGVYDAVARLLNSRPDQVALMDNATAAYAAALTSVPLENGDVVLTTRADYVSNQIMFLNLARRFGVEIVRAPDGADGVVDPNAVEQLVRRYRPKLVAVSHIPTYSGRVQDVAAVGAICRAHQVLYLLDACQSVGQIPVDVETIGCDFLSATGRKYLRGPRGTGFLYASDGVLQRGLLPLLPDLRGADWLDSDTFRPRPDARRFEYWEFSYALLRGLGVAARYAVEVGVEAAAHRAAALAAAARQRLGEIAGVDNLEPDAAPLAAITTFRVDGIEDPSALLYALRRRHLHASITQADSARIDFDQRGIPWALRVSPHYYNTEAEIEIFAAGLEEILTDLRS